MSEEHAVQVRWRTPVPGTGYEKLTDQGWVPMTKEELDALLRSRTCVHLNNERGSVEPLLCDLDESRPR